MNAEIIRAANEFHSDVDAESSVRTQNLKTKVLCDARVLLGSCMRQEIEHNKGACNTENALTDHGYRLQDGKVRTLKQVDCGETDTMPTTLSPSTLRITSPT